MSIILCKPCKKQKRQKCAEKDCDIRPSFGFKGETKMLYCAKHKKNTMINIYDKPCIEDGCMTIPSYNFKGQTNALYCMKHKKYNMVNIKDKICIEAGCQIQSTYNCKGETRPKYCGKHKKLNMVNVKSKGCIEDGCDTRPCFNFVGEKNGLYCEKHKKLNMVNVKDKPCIEEGCEVTPCWNIPGKTNALYCTTHRKSDMVNLKAKKCMEDGCDTRPSYNLIGLKQRLYCNKHKKTDMFYVAPRTCIEEGCKTISVFNLRGEKKTLYCAKHKKTDMVNIVDKTCITPLCDVQVAKSAYNGYCIRCFIHTFPDRPVTKNYKTKEKCTADFITQTFPQFTWVADKRVQDGCSRRRPDLILDLGYQVIIVEIDENQHTDYDCSCENRRIMELSQDVGHRPIIFIRFNPDEYLNNENEKITSCWGVNKNGICCVKKTKQIEWKALTVTQLLNKHLYFLLNTNVNGILMLFNYNLIVLCKR